MTVHLSNACGTVSRSPEWAAGLYRGTFAGYMLRAETLQSVSTWALYGCIFNPGWDKKKAMQPLLCIGQGLWFPKLTLVLVKYAVLHIEWLHQSISLSSQRCYCCFICSDNEHVSTSCLQYVFHITHTHKNQRVCIFQANLPGLLDHDLTIKCNIIFPCLQNTTSLSRCSIKCSAIFWKIVHTKCI